MINPIGPLLQIATLVKCAVGARAGGVGTYIAKVELAGREGGVLRDRVDELVVVRHICRGAEEIAGRGIALRGELPVTGGGSISFVISGFVPLVLSGNPAEGSLGGVRVGEVFLYDTGGEIIKGVYTILGGGVALGCNGLAVGAPVGKPGGIEPTDEGDWFVFHS